MPIVSRTAQAPPATKARSSMRASAGSSARSTASARTTVSTFPTAWARAPHTRAMLLQKTISPDTGSSTGQPKSCRRPTPVHSSAPVSVNAISAGTRSRKAPPMSQKQARFAAKAMNRSAGDCTQTFSSRTAPDATAARRPSARLIPARSSPTGRCLRFEPGARSVPRRISGGRGPRRDVKGKRPMISLQARGAVARGLSTPRTRAQLPTPQAAPR